MVPAILLPALARHNLRAARSAFRAARAATTRWPGPRGAPPAACLARSTSARGASSHDGSPAAIAVRTTTAGGAGSQEVPHAADAARATNAGGVNLRVASGAACAPRAAAARGAGSQELPHAAGAVRATTAGATGSRAASCAACAVRATVAGGAGVEGVQHAVDAARAAAAGGGNSHGGPHAACAAARCSRAGPSLMAALRAGAGRGVRQAAHIACALWLALAGARAGMAAPYVPQSGAEVVETLPRRADALPPDLLALRAQLRAAPKDEALASTLAQRYIALGRSESDPRYFGYAQAALAPWWSAPAPPPQVRLLRATLLQTNHQFAPALQDLDALTSAQPDNAQAWLTRATVQTVRGDYAGATASCAHLPALAGQLVAFTCLAAARANTGPVAPTGRLLQAALARGGEDEPVEIRAWAQTLLAELAARANDPRAGAHFRAALALSPRDSYLLGAYADYLLDQHRAADVQRLLQEHHRVDSLLLRHALALQQAGSPDLRAAVAELQARFNEAARRGSNVHQREQARFVLSLLHDAPSALALAKQNWQVQKEAADVRVLLEAALRAHDAAAAREATAWIARHGMEDVNLAALMRQAGELK